MSSAKGAGRAGHSRSRPLDREVLASTRVISIPTHSRRQRISPSFRRPEPLRRMCGTPERFELHVRVRKFEPSTMAGRREFFCPYIRKGGTTEMTASGFPTRGRAHPSVRGGSLFRSCREKNCSPYRTSQKARSPAWQRALDGQERFANMRTRSNVGREIKFLMREESALWADQPGKPRRRRESALHP